MLRNIVIDPYIKNALLEDIGYDDISTSSSVKDFPAEVSLISKDEGIISGLSVFLRVFQVLESEATFDTKKKDGDFVTNGELIGKIYASAPTLLTAERVALNYLQRMSGISTYTNAMVNALDDSKICVVDTRKTTPNMRIFEKYAVLVGGGKNHRYNLADNVMLKDNHIDAAGSIKNAVDSAKKNSPFVSKIEVETETLDAVKEALDAGADIIMLDNMDIETVKKASRLINGKAEIECSGNITLETIKNYKGLDIDYISSGAITYLAKPLDLSMKNLRAV